VIGVQTPIQAGAVSEILMGNPAWEGEDLPPLKLRTGFGSSFDTPFSSGNRIWGQDSVPLRGGQRYLGLMVGNVQPTPNSALQRGNKKVQTFICILPLYLFHSGWPLLVIMRSTAIKIQFLAQVGDDGGVHVLDMHCDSLPQGSPMDLYYSPMDVDFSEGTHMHNNPDKF